MNNTSSHWLNWPKENLSATERAQQAARREARLEPHMLWGCNDSATGLRTANGASRFAVRAEQRDPLELHQGVDVELMSESTFGKLFPDSVG